MIATNQPIGEYAQNVLDVMPSQGPLSDEDYLRLTDSTSRLIEFTDGTLEPLPMPTDLHQTILDYLFTLFKAFIVPIGGKAHFAAIRLRIRPGKFREPDIILVKDAKDRRRRNRFWIGADLALEVVSKDNPLRDIVAKRADYAEANIPEYWIVNPQTETITVLRLEGSSYIEHGVFARGQQAISVILAGFMVDVTSVFDVDSPPDDPDDAE
ncbi:MAG: Uma2 family endonuclease [Gemmataceae bacterium]|nr:Uma2 family endonuclease [Gemmataceae bacterium]